MFQNGDRIILHKMIKTAGDLEGELKKVPWYLLEKFTDLHISELCGIVKPGNEVKTFEEGYFCSHCHSQLNEEEAWWHYCAVCLVPFNCCEEDNEPCEVCGERADKLVRETYRRIHTTV